MARVPRLLDPCSGRTESRRVALDGDERTLSCAPREPGGARGAGGTQRVAGGRVAEAALARDVGNRGPGGALWTGPAGRGADPPPGLSTKRSSLEGRTTQPCLPIRRAKIGLRSPRADPRIPQKICWPTSSIQHGGRQTRHQQRYVSRVRGGAFCPPDLSAHRLRIISRGQSRQNRHRIGPLHQASAPPAYCPYYVQR